MPFDNFLDLLDRAAVVCGIEPEFWDIWGRRHATTQEAKQVILRAMGVAAENAESLAESLAARTRREWERLLPPTVVTSLTSEIVIPLSFPAEWLEEIAHVCLRCEEGVSSQHDVRLADLKALESIEMDGKLWQRREVRIAVELPLGYHEVTLEVASARATAAYIVTPQRA